MDLKKRVKKLLCNLVGFGDVIFNQDEQSELRYIIKELTKREEKLVEALNRFVPFDIKIDTAKLYGGDREFQLAIEQAKATLRELGVSDDK